MRTILTAALLALLAVPAVADDHGNLANPIRFIAQAVDGAVRYDRDADTLTGWPLIERATQHDPTLLAPFRNFPQFRLDARREGVLSSVLLCDRDTVLFEDAGCTGPLDWNGGALPRACGFALDLKEVCPASASR